MFLSHPNSLQENKQAYRNVYDLSCLYTYRPISQYLSVLRGEEPKIQRLLQFVHFPHWLVLVHYLQHPLSKSVNDMCYFNPSLHFCHIFKARFRGKGGMTFEVLEVKEGSWYKTVCG